MVQFVGFVCKIFGTSLKTGLLLIGNSLKPLEVAASATDANIQKKVFGSGTTLILLNEEMNHIMKTGKYLEKQDLVSKYTTETIKNESKERKWEFLGMLLETLGGSLLGNFLTLKGTIRAGKGVKKASKAKRAGKGTIRACEGTAGQNY